MPTKRTHKPARRTKTPAGEPCPCQTWDAGDQVLILRSDVKDLGAKVGERVLRQPNGRAKNSQKRTTRARK